MFKKSDFNLFTVEELFLAFADLYSYEYGINKVKEIEKKVEANKSLVKTMSMCTSQHISPNVSHYLSALNSSIYFIFSKSETICLGALIAQRACIYLVDQNLFHARNGTWHETTVGLIIQCHKKKMSSNSIFDKLYSRLGALKKEIDRKLAFEDTKRAFNENWASRIDNVATILPRNLAAHQDDTDLREFEKYRKKQIDSDYATFYKIKFNSVKKKLADADETFDWDSNYMSRDESIIYLRKNYEITLMAIAIMQLKVNTFFEKRDKILQNALEQSGQFSQFNMFSKHQVAYMVDAFNSLFEFGEIDGRGMNDALVEYVEMPTNKEEWVEQLPIKMMQYMELIRPVIRTQDENSLAKILHLYLFEAGTFCFGISSETDSLFEDGNDYIDREHGLTKLYFRTAIIKAYSELVIDDLFIEG